MSPEDHEMEFEPGPPNREDACMVCDKIDCECPPETNVGHFEAADEHDECCTKAGEIAKKELEGSWEGKPGDVSVPIKIIIDGESHDGVMITRQKEKNETRKHIEVNHEGEQGSRVAAQDVGYRRMRYNGRVRDGCVVAIGDRANRSQVSDTYCFLDGLTVVSRPCIRRSWYPDVMSDIRRVSFRTQVLDFIEWKWCVSLNLN